jgi:putative ABC transport system permease protein
VTPLRLLPELGREALVGLVRNKVRAGLSMLGISWGIVSVVMLLAYGEGFNAALLRGFKGAFGDGVTVMFPGQTSMQAGGERAGKRIRMRLTDAEAIRELPLLKGWSPEFMQVHPVTWGTRQASYLVRAVSPDYAVMRNQPAAVGHFFDAEDVRLQRRVAFLGSEVAMKLFGNLPPVGQTIRIKGMLFEVIGVQKEKVQLSNYNRPDKQCIFIPYTTASQLWMQRYRAADDRRDRAAGADQSRQCGPVVLDGHEPRDRPPTVGHFDDLATTHPGQGLDHVLVQLAHTDALHGAERRRPFNDANASFGWIWGAARS